MKIALFLALVISSFAPASACMNGETKELKNGHMLYADPLSMFAPNGHQFLNVNEVLLNKLDSAYRKTKDVAYLSDKGYVLIVMRKYEEAIQLYLNIEKKNPNRYSTASNIGTVYELIGENELALQWIKKAIRLNKKSHFKSEWIHVKILEAKIKGLQNLDKTYSINDFGNATLPTTSLTSDSLEKLQSQLSYQLNERMSFVKPKDKIVSLLLFELGNICYLLNPDGSSGDYTTGEEALENYKNAVKYGFNNSLIQQRIALAQKQKPVAKVVKPVKENHTLLIIALVLIVLFLFFLIWIYIKKRRTT